MRKRTLTILVFLILVTVAGTAIVYPMLPERIATHWNATGTPDGFSSRIWGAWLMPLLLAALIGLFAVLPRIDPLKKNYPAFQGMYDIFVIAIVAFMVFVQGLTIAFNLGYAVPFSAAMLVGISLLFIVIGRLLPGLKPNWFMGIRTPWTLCSETVWEKTHAIGGKLFVVAGVASFLGAFLSGAWPIYVMLGTLLPASLGMVVYSYVAYRSENHQETDRDA